MDTSQGSSVSLDTQSSELEIRQAVVAANGDIGRLRQLEIDTGVPSGRLVEEGLSLQPKKGQPAPDGHYQLAFDAMKQLWASGAWLAYDAQRFWTYQPPFWRAREHVAIRQEVLRCYMCQPDAYGPGRANSIIAGAIKALEVLAFKPDFPLSLGDKPLPVVNQTSGELWRTGGQWDLRPARSWSRQVSVCPVSFEPDAVDPLFDGYLKAIAGHSQQPAKFIRHIEEVAGSTLLTCRPLPTIVILQGAGANGKSLLLRVVAAVVGDDQVLWSSIERLSGDRFSLPGLRNKRLYIDDDARDGARLDEGLLKSIAEDKPLSTRRAHDPDLQTFRANVLPIIATNGTPSLSDSSYGFERRL